MVRIVSVPGSTLVPDTSQPLNQLLQAFQVKRGETEEEKRQAEIQRQIDILTGGIIEDVPQEGAIKGSVEGEGGISGVDVSGRRVTVKEQEAALLRLSAIDPQIANSIRQSLERGDKVELAAIKEGNDNITRQALLIQRQPDFASKQRAITQEAQEAAARGEDISGLIELSNMSESQLDLELQKKLIQGADLDKLTVSALEPQEVAPIGGEIVKQANISETGNIILRQPDGTFTETNVQAASKTSGSGGLASAVTKIFDNGTTIQALPNGKTLVKNPAGVIVEGDARIEVLKLARSEEILFAGLKKGTEAASAAAIRQSEEAFKKIAPIKLSISNIDKAVQALDEGAASGAIVSKFPSIRESSVKLDNMQKAMGLDVVGNVTFGALSKGELDLALAVAIPLRLKPAALRRWLIDKKAAQNKLVAYIEDAAIFLGTPGNTIAGWLEAQEAISTPDPDAESPGDVRTGKTTPEGLPIFQRADGSTYAVSAD